jgi:hypothetical protein
VRHKQLSRLHSVSKTLFRWARLKINTKNGLLAISSSNEHNVCEEIVNTVQCPSGNYSRATPVLSIRFGYKQIRTFYFTKRNWPARESRGSLAVEVFQKALKE